MQYFRHCALSGSVLPDQEDRGADGRELFDLRDEFGQLRTLADQPAFDVS
jgi:hypothetical protein